MTTKDDFYDEAVSALDKFNQDHDYPFWDPDRGKTKINQRCVYLYGNEKQYCKYDSLLKQILEYSAPGLPTLRDYVARAGDAGGGMIGMTIIGPRGQVERSRPVKERLYKLSRNK